VSIARKFTIDEYATEFTPRPRSHDKVDVAGTEAEQDSAAGASVIRFERRVIIQP
jgi:hypothetical protein